MDPIIVWQLALAHVVAQPEFADTAVTSWHLDGTAHPHLDLTVAGVQLMLHPARSASPLRYFIVARDRPDGLYGDGPVVTLQGDPSEALCQLFRAARQHAQTRCHAGAGHLPGYDHGAAGVLCWPCYVSLCRLYSGARQR